MEELLATSAVARILNISESGVRLLEKRGELVARRDSSGRRLFDRTEVERFARSKTRQRAAKKGGSVQKLAS